MQSAPQKQTLIAFVAVLAISFIVLSFSIHSPVYSLLLFLNAEIATFQLFTRQDKPFTLHKIVNLFVLVFFVMANVMQFSANEVVSSVQIPLLVDDYENFQFVVLIILILFNSVYAIQDSKNKQKDYHSHNCNSRKLEVSTWLLVFISYLFLFIVVYGFRENILLLFFRGLEDEFALVGGENDMNVAGDVLISRLIRPVPFVCYMLSLLSDKNKKTKLVLFISMLIALFPTGLSRNAVAMYWIPVLILNVKIFWRRNFFVYTMLFGLFVFFPFLDIFRRFTGEIEFTYSLDFMNSMHFDASQEFMIVMKQGYVTYGSQLMGALLFFVPRSIWPTKPIGSGAFLANHSVDAFTNISMPFFAEGYINFGFIGIFVFTVILSVFCSYFDSNFWLLKEKKVGLFPLVYIVLVSSMTFIMRGDLMSSYAYTIAIIIDIYFVYHVTKKHNITI